MTSARVLTIATAAVITVSTFCFPGPASPSAGSLDVQPQTVMIDLMFGGRTIRVEGSAPAESEIAVVVSGEAEPLELKVKGKAWGLLWLNVGHVTFTSMPTLYLVASSVPLGELASKEVLDQYRVGYQALEASTGLEPDTSDRATLFHELIRLKESEGLYSIAEGAIAVNGESPDRQLVTEFRLPPRIPPGQYHVELLGFLGGQGQKLDSTELNVSPTGLVRFITDLAVNRGLLYGILAVVIAIAAGLITGVLFGLGGKSGH